MTSSISLKSPFRTIDDPALIEKKLATEAKIARELEESPEKANLFSIFTPTPDFNKWRSDQFTIQGRKVGFCSTRDDQNSMENQLLIEQRSITIKQVNYPFSLFGIFDGHCGSIASEYIKNNTLRILVQQINEQCPIRLTKLGIWNALKLTPVHLHENFLKANPENFFSGTTLLIALIINDFLWIANVGDSRAILDDGTHLNEDASPTAPRHKRSIEKRHGKVRNGKAGGLFSTARALGDGDVGYLNRRPKITCYSLEDLCKPQLILACAGLSKKVKSKCIADAAQQNVDLPVRELAKTLTYSALKAGSSDDISVMIIRL